MTIIITMRVFFFFTRECLYVDKEKKKKKEGKKEGATEEATEQKKKT